MVNSFFVIGFQCLCPRRHYYILFSFAIDFSKEKERSRREEGCSERQCTNFVIGRWGSSQKFFCSEGFQVVPVRPSGNGKLTAW
jgi:hypothetical protein